MSRSTRVPLRKDGVDTMTTVSASIDRLSAGMYWLSEVRNLAGVPTDLSRRFVRTYKGQRGLWGGAEQREGRYYYATFLDLMELRIVNAFHISGVPWQRICKTAEYARQRFGTDFPFSHRRFQTDGKDILIAAVIRLSRSRAGVSWHSPKSSALPFSSLWTTWMTLPCVGIRLRSGDWKQWGET